MPKQVDHDQRRHEIAEATWRAIDELGIDGTTMRAIAERAGCTIGRLNHYFDCREDLLVAALQQAHQRAAARMTSARAGRSGRDALRAVLLEALPLDGERRAEWKVWLTFWAQAISTPSLRDEHVERYREWRHLVARLVAEAEPTLRALQIERVVDVLLSTIDGIGVHTLMSPDHTSARRARRTVDTSLDTLLAPGS